SAAADGPVLVGLAAGVGDTDVGGSVVVGTAPPGAGGTGVAVTVASPLAMVVISTTVSTSTAAPARMRSRRHQ
ncbi:MAG: hypothetical protein ACLGIF_06280, partial [Actinomycetes bacterium]